LFPPFPYLSRTSYETRVRVKKCFGCKKLLHILYLIAKFGGDVVVLSTAAAAAADDDDDDDDDVW